VAYPMHIRCVDESWTFVTLLILQGSSGKAQR
jgi:hypothetical protein